MGNKEDIAIIKEFKRRLTNKIPLKKIILFGSRAKGENVNEFSDFDLLIISDKFEGIKSFKRSPNMYDYWTENIPVDFLCLTSKEFNNLKDKITIVNEAVRTGIEI